MSSGEPASATSARATWTVRAQLAGGRADREGGPERRDTISTTPLAITPRLAILVMGEAALARYGG
jgi:hypothetical protein